MIRLRKLYSDPEIFDPISFEAGLNLIVGEKSEGSNKTNGVGKSVSVEFLQYCLLKKTSQSRVAFIPQNIIDPDVQIRLDMDFNSNKVTIIRSIGQPDRITLFKNGEEINFESLDDASDYLGNLYFEAYPSFVERISFRNLLGTIIRDEKSEFKDIIKCYDTDKNIPRDFKPHLFFLGFGLDLYSELQHVIDDLQKKTKFLTETGKLLTNNNEIKVSDAKARLNELASEVTRINASMEQFRTNDSFETVQSELAALDTKLKDIRERQKVLKYDIRQIESLPQPEHISETEIAFLFNQFKQGLGDMIKKSLDDVKQLRHKIDHFRNTIINENLVRLKSDLVELNEQARKLDQQYSEKISLLDNGELLGNLKTAIRIFNEKNSEYSALNALISQYNDTEKEKKNLSVIKNNKIGEFDMLLIRQQNVIDSFEQTILEIHDRIFGNRHAHFEIATKNTTQSKEFLYFDLRTDDDHSWSTERMKVFIYDMALLFNEYTKKHHPLFLVHDNIFNVDNDSLEKSLNFVYSQELNRADEFQYILTINRDMVEALEEKQILNFSIEDHIRARFTKDNRFLKIKYSENKKSR